MDADAMRNKIKNQLKGVGIVIMVMGMVFAGLGLHAKSRQAELDAHGITEPAQITDAAVESGAKSNKRCIVTVQWGDAKSPQTKKFEVTKTDFQSRVDAKGRLISANTTVRQIPGQPGTALLAGGAYPFAGAQGAGLGVILFGALFVVLGFRLRPDPVV